MRVAADGFTLRDSAPCRDCHKTLTLLGIKKVIYTSNSGVVQTRLEDCKTSHRTWGRRMHYRKLEKHQHSLLMGTASCEKQVRDDS